MRVLFGIADGAFGPSPMRVGVPIRIESGPPTRVWVVDDDPIVALYLGELLHEHGFAVTTFADPQAALHAYEADPRRVDVVVTDQRMPKLSGDVLASAMLRLRPQVRVILCTGYCDVIDERGALAIGVQHFFRKPFDAQALLRAVRGCDGH
ncbi:response regulator [Ideonella azotifigens]|uniref:response regulator n=1 Tax=Ideonella azotifigens TaxID=513160 RepID=UPI00147700DA|nr:response regulator [Ideonella azotifigens]